jgi:predicted nucleic acid-binding protein
MPSVDRALLPRGSNRRVLLRSRQRGDARFDGCEAFAKGLIPSANKVRALRANRNIIPTLTEYWSFTERILSLDLLFVATNEEILRIAQAERRRGSLLTNDSIIVACMRQYGVSALATNDPDFDQVDGIHGIQAHRFNVVVKAVPASIRYPGSRRYCGDYTGGIRLAPGGCRHD